MKNRLSPSLQNVAKISTGTVAGQFISIITLPVITRIYGAEIMGIWATIYSMAAVVNTFSDLGLTQSVMVGKDENLQILFSVITQFVFLISGASVIVIGAYCLLFLKYDFHMTIVVSGFTFIYSVTLQLVQLIGTWANRSKEYSVMMKNPIVNYGATAIIAIVLGALGFKTYGYYIGVVSGQILTLVYLCYHMPVKIKVPVKQEIRETIDSNIQFVKYQMPSNIAIQLRNQLPNLLIGGLYGNTVLGFYSVSQKLLNIPITFIGQSLGKVFYQRCAEMHREGYRVGEFVYRNLKRAISVAFIPMVVLAAFGDAAVVMFFGEEYAIGGMIVRVVVFRSFFTFVSTATQGMDIVLGKQRYSMNTGIVQIIVTAAAVVVSYYMDVDIVWCSALMTIGFIVVQIAYFCIMFRVMDMPVINYLKSIIVSLLAVALTAFGLRYAFLLLSECTGWMLFKWFEGFLVLK